MAMMKGINNIKESFKTKQVKYGGYAALLTLTIIITLILLNVMAARFLPQIDLTSNRLYSVSEQTIQVLDRIKTPVKFYGLWRPGEENQDVMSVVNLCLSRNRNLSLQVIDPDRNPGFVIRYDKERQGITRGSLIVEGEKGFKVISPGDMYDFTQNQSGGKSITGVAAERRILSALLFVGSGTTPVVYEIIGHDEDLLSEIDLQETVERENFTVKSLNLLLSVIPPDASVLILNNPQKDLSRAEVEKLLSYLEGGGRLIVMADYNIRDLSNLNEVLKSYGLEFNYGIVHETNTNYVAIDASSEWPDLLDHEITRPLMNKSKTPVVLVEPMPFSILETKRLSIEITPIMLSSSEAFFRTDLDNDSAAKIPSDIQGPFILGATVTDPSWVQENDPQTRIVAIGCGNLLPIYKYLGFDANRDFFMNSIVWLGDQPENISVRSKSILQMPLRLTLTQIIIFGVFFIFIFPMVFFITGTVTWLKRRHL
jgi:hypothetical protein